MRKLTALLLVLCLGLSLAACQSPEPQTPEEPPSTAGEESTVSEESSREETESGPEEPAVTDPEDEDALYEEILYRFGGTYDGGELRTEVVSLYFGRSWSSPEELTPADYFSWYLSQLMNEDLTFEEKQEKYASPYGEDTGWFIPEGIYVPAVQEYFDVTEDHLQSDPDVYVAEHKGYYIGTGGGIGERPAIHLEEVEKDGNIRHLHVTLSTEGGETESVVLTVEVFSSGGFHYLSFQKEG